LKTLFATVIAGGLLLAVVPAFAATSAPVHDGYLTIGGPKRLHASAQLRVPIACSVACKTKTITKLTTPGDVLGPDKAQGHLGAGQTRKLIIKLNTAAKQDISDHPNSRLRVEVFATSSSGDEHAHAIKTFKFSGS
jgi:hypothetical protein